jgi:hypothetical protein
VLDVASPKFQFQVGEVPVAAVEVLVNAMGTRAHALPAVKLAAGAGCMLIAVVIMEEHPRAEVAVRVTLYSPAVA